MTFDIEQMRKNRDAGTPGPWIGYNMTHAEGRAMTPEEIGEYVTNSVKMGEPGRFLFVSAKHDDGKDCDICHTGNGPKGMANTARIMSVPDMEAEIERLTAVNDELLAALEAIVATWDGPKYSHFMGPNIDLARAALTKAEGQRK